MRFEGLTIITPTGKTPILEVDRLNPYILTGGSPGRIEKVVKFLQNSTTIKSERGHIVVNGLYDDIRVSAVSIGMGPSSAAILLPEIIESAEGKFIVMLRLGTAGSLQPYVKKGHLHIPTAAVRDEGATQAIVGPEYPAVASLEIIPIMVAAAEKYGYKLNENLWLGPVHTKDDLYFKETPQFSPRRNELLSRLRAYKEMGVVSSEMEFSTYCILRDYYERYLNKRILTGCILAIISEPQEEGRIDITGVNVSEIEEDLIKIGLQTFKMIDSLTKGEKVELDDVIRKMLVVPPRCFVD